MKKLSSFLASESGLIHILPLLIIIATVGIISYLLISSAAPFKGGLFSNLFPRLGSKAAGSLVVTGVAVNNSSVKVFYKPVPGAIDYRIFDITNPNNVKYAGFVHLTPSTGCPGSGCFQHFLTQADGVTPVFPYQPSVFSYPNGGTGGSQVLDIPGNQIDWNNVGDGQPHTLVVEAVDQLGPAPQGNLYNAIGTTDYVPLINPLPAGAMLGSNKGVTNDRKISTNGQGPYTNNPQVIAQSQAFVVQANRNLNSIPSKSSATQTFFDTFDNAENSTLTQVTRDDNFTDAFGNLGMMKYTLNAGTPKAWDLEYRRANNRDSMPFISGDHFMDVLFDGATPGTSAPTHTIYSSLAMSPVQTVDMSGGKILHMTMEVDTHQDQRRWLDFNLSPASDPLKSWDINGNAINPTNQGLFLEVRDGGCTLDIFTGQANSGIAPIGTAGGSASSTGARLWGQAGSVGGAPIMCGWDQMYNPATFSKNGLGFDDKSRYDFFVSQTHAALYQDGHLIIQSDIPAGSFPWGSGQVKTYYTHYLYHSDADLGELQNTTNNGQNVCYPMNSYWYNNPLKGTPATLAAGGTICNTAYPPGYGFTYSDERHWDNMGFEVLPTSDVPAGNDFSAFGSLVKLPAVQAPQFTSGGTPVPTPTPPSATPTPTPTPRPTQTPVPVSGIWVNVTPTNVDLVNPLDCSNYGTISVVVDPVRSSNMYTHFDCQGIWKSTNFGQTWNGPINTGTGGAGASGAGGIAIASGPTGQPPILYSAGIRGTGFGFWKSVDGGVSWTNYNIAPAPQGRQDVYPPVVDPYDGNHLIMVGHEQNWLVQSTDGGQNWTNIPMNSGMNENGGTAFLAFINTGNASTTRNTWLYMAQGNGGGVGTWRTTNGGASWSKVDTNEHPHGEGQIYQPDNNGVVFMAGIYSGLGWGVLRSNDYGQTWAHVGNVSSQAVVYGTPNKIYSAYAWACGSCIVDPTFQSASQPGIIGWTPVSPPSGMAMGPAQVATVFNGTSYVLVSANWMSGLWRYVETSGSTPTPTPQPTPTPTSPTSVCQGADIDKNGKVDIFDYNTLVTNFGKSGVGPSGGDIDGSGTVNIFDYNILVTNFGKTGC